MSSIGREVDRGGTTTATSQRQNQQQRMRADCNELLHKRVSEHELSLFINALARGPFAIRLAWQKAWMDGERRFAHFTFAASIVQPSRARIMIGHRRLQIYNRRECVS